jgi:hypothetical protein
MAPSFEKILVEVINTLPLIYPRWKRTKKELAGWILKSHLLWLDNSFCTANSVFADDTVCSFLSTVGAVSFHTHPAKDNSGKESISGTDRASACAFGHEVVFTSKGIYLLIPKKRKTVFAMRSLEEKITADLEKKYGCDDSSATQRAIEFERIAKKEFACYCNKLCNMDPHNP